MSAVPGPLTLAGVIMLFQRSSEDSYRGRVFGAVSALEGVTVLACALAAGYLSLSATVPVLAIQGGGYVVAGLVMLRWLKAAPVVRMAPEAPATVSGRWSRRRRCQAAPLARRRLPEQASLATGKARHGPPRDRSGRRNQGDRSMPVAHPGRRSRQAPNSTSTWSTSASRATRSPETSCPSKGTLPGTALQVVRDELILDGNARLNLATFVTTWMEPEADMLMAECAAKNMIDKDEYPQTAELEKRCVNILGSLWNAPPATRPPAAHHRVERGLHARRDGAAVAVAGPAAGGRARRDRPNLVMGSNVQVCWEKFCRYWDVEPPLRSAGAGTATPARHRSRGEVRREHDRRGGHPGLHHGRQLRARPGDQPGPGPAAGQPGPDILVHVDAASGGFVAPFIQPDLEWDFRVPRVASINASGHKYGLVYPGVGWVIWRTPDALPEDLIFRVNYLGGEMPTFALNFSRPGAQVAAQYYNFIRLGRVGYQRVQQTCQDVALHLSGEIAKIGPFELLWRAGTCRCSRSSCATTSLVLGFDLSERLPCAAGRFLPTRSPRT